MIDIADGLKICSLENFIFSISGIFKIYIGFIYIIWENCLFFLRKLIVVKFEKCNSCFSVKEMYLNFFFD